MADVLIVDDDPQVRRTFRRLLESGGHSVEEAANGKEAFRALETQAFDVVLSDIYMPEMDGVEFLIRLHDTHPGMRLIATSGGGYRDKEDLLDDAQALGAFRTLPKPVDREDLLEAVEAALEES